MATDSSLAAGASFTYTICVYAAFDAGANAGTTNPTADTYDPCTGTTDPGEDQTAYNGLFNESFLDINGDGMPEEIDTACADIPIITHVKSLVGDPVLGPDGNYKVTYEVTVTNEGAAEGLYSLFDSISYDPDVRVDSIVWTPMGGSGMMVMLGNPASETRFQMATDSSLAAGASFTYTICVYAAFEAGANSGTTNPTMDMYDPCTGTTDPGEDQTAYNGLFNESFLDINGDGMPEEIDTACADIPIITHVKSLVGDPLLGPDGNYKVTYEVTVTNEGAAEGLYSLFDSISYDPDVRVDSIVWTPMGGTAMTATLADPASETRFQMAIDSSLAAGASFTYTICVYAAFEAGANSGTTNPTMDMYDPCTGTNDPGEGQTAYNGLFNESFLDINGDGMPEEIDTACADIPVITHEKSLAGTPVLGPDGNYKVTYEVTVTNEGAADGVYSLFDSISYDPDVRVDSIVWTPLGGSAMPVTLGSPASETRFQMATDSSLAAGASFTYTICVYAAIEAGANAGTTNPTMDMYDPCTGTTDPGEDQTAYNGLFNESFLDINGDGMPEEIDTACADIPMLTHIKELVTAPELQPNGNYKVTYQLIVSNNGSVAEIYDLYDSLRFDGDIRVDSINIIDPMGMSSAITGALSNTSGFLVADDSTLDGGEMDTFLICIYAAIDFVSTDAQDMTNDMYDPCANPSDPHSEQQAFMGLFNESSLDVGSNGTTEEVDTACTDLPVISHVKSLAMDPELQPGGNYKITYEIIVTNEGLIDALYDLTDTLAFDGDVRIDSINYITPDGTSYPASLGSPANETGILVAMDSIIGGGEMDTYRVCVFAAIDYSNPGGNSNADGDYDACVNPLDPGTGQQSFNGLFNESHLDMGGDGSVEEQDTACADLPLISHVKSLAMDPELQPGGNYKITYDIAVTNEGMIDALYDLTDTLAFDGDVRIDSINYITPDGTSYPASLGSPANETGILVAMDSIIGGGEMDTYRVCVFAAIDYSNPGGNSNADGDYDACVNPLDPGTGQQSFNGLFNESHLDMGGDGSVEEQDTACADLPLISHVKSLAMDPELQPGGNYKITYDIAVTNEGMIDALYDLTDTLAFDGDVRIDSINYITPDGTSYPASLGSPANETGILVAMDSVIGGGEMDTYRVCVFAAIDYSNPGGNSNTDGDYDACINPLDPGTGQQTFNGLFNESQLDMGGDGSVEEQDTACADLPVISHVKSLAMDPELQPGGNYKITYDIAVTNEGMIDALYDLSDTLAFDGDVRIDSINYITPDGTTHPASPGSPANETGLLIAMDSVIGGGEMDTYRICVFAAIDYSNPGGNSNADGDYDPCANPMDPGTNQHSFNGLFNESQLDMGGDGSVEEQDTACADLPVISHVKSLAMDPELQPGGNYKITYDIAVTNEGMIDALYDLTDTLAFDGDVRIDSINYITPDGTTYPASLGSPVNETGILIAMDSVIGGGEMDTYRVCVFAAIDYSNPGGNSSANENYDPCSGIDSTSSHSKFAGLFNESFLDVGGDGSTEEIDTACADIPPFCPNINCYLELNTSLGPDCMLTLTPDMFIVGNVPSWQLRYITIEIRTTGGQIIPGNTLDASYLGRTVHVFVTVDIPGCPTGTCSTSLSIKGVKKPKITGTDSYTVYCDGPFLSLDPSDSSYPYRPTAAICNGSISDVQFVADWIDAEYDCTGDTARLILREWEAYSNDGTRTVSFDTIIVQRYPQIDERHIFCQEKDTIYCADSLTHIGPFITYDSLNTGICDTTYLVQLHDRNRDGYLEFESKEFESKCGLRLHVDYKRFSNGGCANEYKVTVDIKQDCFGTAQNTCMVNPPAGTLPNGAVQIAQGYWRCTFWVTDLDTLGPTVKIKDSDEVVLVQTNDHDCAAEAHLPTLQVYDDWSGVKQVKASIENIGSTIMTYNSSDSCYESHATFTLPKRDDPYEVRYEVYDSCHNVTEAYTYLFVKDTTKPIPVADKGVIVSLSSKKVWVDTEKFDEGSWDNCGIKLQLARRVDWYESCIDLCNGLLDTCWVGEHHDTIWAVQLETDKKMDEVEAHYAKILDWLKTDADECNALLYNSWQYDLLRYGTRLCRDHPYEQTAADFRALVDQAWEQGLKEKFLPYEEGSLEAQLDQYEQIGGGWSDAVPFDCSDACENVKVEILVMDYWCNWAVTWMDVWVEDKTPVQIAQDVTESESLTCKTYKDNHHFLDGAEHPVSLEYIVQQATIGNADALTGLDRILGGYQKAWIDPYGKYVDQSGAVLELKGSLVDSTCACSSEIKPIRIYDEHLGYQWIDSVVSECYYLEDTVFLNQGIVLGNCADNIYCEQEVWTDFDPCGAGTIFRKWKIWQHCSYSDGLDSIAHSTDTIYRHQQISIHNECDLNTAMFDIPWDTAVHACGIEYDQAGNVGGDLHPDQLGWATYNFDDDCRLVGIGYEDKVYQIVGGDAACFKILRSWYFADWCDIKGTVLTGPWWNRHPDLIRDRVIQKIMVIDAVAPECAFLRDLDTVEIQGCNWNLEHILAMRDTCGIESYNWELYEIIQGEQIQRAIGGDQVDRAEHVANIKVDELSAGEYLLKARVRDACENESFCEDFFKVIGGKKPTPVCVSSLSVRLTPLDRDNNGIADTAMAVIWAQELNRSSTAGCEGRELEYRLSLLIGDESDDIFTDDADSLNLGCQNIGTRMARLWVIDESGMADYCDVLLVIQSGGEGCDNGQFGNQEFSTLAPQQLDRFQLYQNRPNPWRESTIIGFRLPESSRAVLTVFDMSGREIKRYEAQYDKGYHEVELRFMDLGHVGALYYQLETDKYIATKRMIVIQ